MLPGVVVPRRSAGSLTRHQRAPWFQRCQ